MLYQETFQFGEDPNSQNLSIVRYINQYLDGEARCFPVHTHIFYEINYTFDHSVIYEFANRTVKAGPNSLVFFSPLCVHSQCQDIRKNSMTIQFSNRLLQNNLTNFGEHSILVPNSLLHDQGQLILSAPGHEKIQSILQKLAETLPPFYSAVSDNEVKPFSFPPATSLQHSALVLSLLAELLQKDYLRISNIGLNTSLVSKMQHLMNRLIEHPEEKLSMEEAATIINMSYSNFCRTFKAATGHTYVDFCNLQRVARAKELLKYTDLSVTEISMQLNIGSISYFNRIFKKFTDTSPLTYRMLSRSTPPTSK